MSILPTTLEQALHQENPTYVSGGTDLMPLLKNRVRNDRELVFLHRILQLKEIRQESQSWFVGAGVTLFDLANHPQLSAALPALAQAALATASPQIRNVATLGGNVMQDRRCIYFNQSHYWRQALPLCFKTGGSVCHQIPNSPVCRAIYYSDLATALICYDAQVEYQESGAAQTCGVGQLIARHSQVNGLGCEHRLPVLLTGFRIPALPAGERSGFYKYAMRASVDFPLLNFALRCGGPRQACVVAGAVAATPVALPQTAALLCQPQIPDQQVMACCEQELKALAQPIREACIAPAQKRELFAQMGFLLHLRRES